MLATNSALTFCHVSGAGTDSSESGRVRWARVKGKTENALLALPFKAAYMFRPGYIQPMKGARTKVAAYRRIYAVLGWLYPLLGRLAPRHTTITVQVGRARISVARQGYPKSILAPVDIYLVAAGAH